MPKNAMTRAAPAAMSPTSLAKPMTCTFTAATGLRLDADLLELARHFDVVEALPGVGVELLQPAAHDGAGEVVGHQPADDTSLDGVLAHPGEARLGGPEVRRQHVGRQ